MAGKPHDLGNDIMVRLTATMCDESVEACMCLHVIRNMHVYM